MCFHALKYMETAHVPVYTNDKNPEMQKSSYQLFKFLQIQNSMLLLVCFSVLKSNKSTRAGIHLIYSLTSQILSQ